MESGHGFIAEINPTDGSCNWAIPIGGVMPINGEILCSTLIPIIYA